MLQDRYVIRGGELTTQTDEEFFSEHSGREGLVAFATGIALQAKMMAHQFQYADMDRTAVSRLAIIDQQVGDCRELYRRLRHAEAGEATP